MTAVREAGFRCGTIAIVGRPNVGKSTLLNAFVGQKISITSRKPQTTRHRVTGVLTKPDIQYVFVDTPGFQTKHGGALNRLLNRTVRDALAGVDIVLFVVEAGEFGDADRTVLKLLPHETPVFLVVNKRDKLPQPGRMLSFLDRMSKEFEFAEIVPVSATKGKSVGELLKSLTRHLPEQPPLFDADALTDRSERFLAAELLREKVFRLLGDELPYACAVIIEQFEEQGRLRRIHAAIVVEKENHKAIVIGKAGDKMKAIAAAARVDMEKLFDAKVYLEVWVKVRKDWTADPAALKRLGFEHA
jgi:GTP-binding protein Era